ncbi:hypothetical protein F5B22DRAFT_176222 [Xylaria bambusicola]|uniref:uncharacterized protein n=1 Tax=Xylaria bambusicola TaxID=326684 RepID=UPI002008AB08|nr:uncharacterized protein F5B22DRAFT_176222 [Xylaria bambusicola]KAI0516697.1 hypothetical protein F5B22DRAFT_176222 [Xylaria bambusicola]
MAEEVEALVLAQFREIVEKGKAAIENVESAGSEAPAPMLKAAQSLVDWGEKALKKIEPVSTANYEEYGSHFVNALKENDEIAQFRSQLEELLWDFDEYIEVKQFDADKFSELQKVSKTAALKIVDILRRMMKLVPPVPILHSHAQSEAGPSMNGSVSGAITAEAGLDNSLPNNTEALRSSRPASDIDRTSWRRSGPSEPPSGPPPAPPSINPWQVGKLPTSPVANPEEWEGYERRPPVAPDSPTIPQTQLVSPTKSQIDDLRSREVDEDGIRDEHEQQLRAASRSEGSLSPLQTNRWTTSTQGSTDSARSPHMRSHAGFGRNYETFAPSQGYGIAISRAPSGTSATGNLSPRPDIRPGSRAASSLGRDQDNNITVQSSYPPRTTSVTNQNSSSYVLSSRRPSTESINSSVFDVVESLSPTDTGASRANRPSVQSPTAPYQAAGFPPPRYPGPPPLYQSPVPARRASGMTIQSQSSGGRTAHPAMSPRGLDEGLIPVDMESSLNEAPIRVREPDCAITPASSFYKQKGLCKGAEEAQRGQLGFKRIKRPVGGFSTAIVAKCTHCLFELDFKSVEQDLNNESSGSFTSNTIGFRLRILQKSHLPIRVIDEQLYSCLFCIQLGHTLEESDATVFFNQKQLFAHLARHPRPLPRIPGVTVIEDPELPPHLKDNFDLHFPHPPTESVMVGITREVARLPTAVATDTRKISQGVMRLPPDRQAALHFCIGAKIVGIEFPIKYEGKWAIGWHDGVRAVFEADAVQLQAPPNSEVKMQGTSSIQAVARWKWNQKGDDRWLKFDKGDIIKNISWAYADHWCWSGTTSKGSGLFPQSHLDPNSIKTSDSEDGGSVASWEKKNPLKFSLRGKKESRKAGSFSSQEGWKSNIY